MRRVDDRLRDILEALDDIALFSTGLDEESFSGAIETDRKSYQAFRGALMQIGEAVKDIPEDIRRRHSAVDWRGLAGMRDIIVHQYFRFQGHLVWRAIVEDLPRPRTAVEREMKTLK